MIFLTAYLLSFIKRFATWHVGERIKDDKFPMKFNYPSQDKRFNPSVVIKLSRSSLEFH